jgi:predicted PurR-regulated permease PerM
MLWPFLPAIVTSATIAVLSYPGFRRMRDRFRHPAGAGLLTTILIFFLVLVPVWSSGFFVGPVLFVISLTLVEVARRSLDPSPSSPATPERSIGPAVADAGSETKGRASRLVL